jgi:hypothetical protein
MAAKVVVGISTTFDAAGAAAAKVAIGQVGNEASKADKALLSYAQSAAKLQAAQGNAAGAAQTLTSALSQVDRSTKQAIAAETQLTAANNALAKSSAAAAGGFQVLPRTIAGLSGEAAAAASSITSLVGSFTAVSGAVMAFKGVYDIAQLGAQAQLVNTRFQSLAQSAGTTGDALMKALRAGSGGEISDLNLQLAANKAQLLGVANSAEQFGVLMSIARDRAQQMGISTTQAFDDLTTGLGRGSKLILDNLGILVNAQQANDTYAASIGKTSAALTDQERKQALINQVLKDGQASISATGGAVESTASQIAQGQAAFDNLKTAVGGLAAVKLGPLAAEIGTIASAIAGVGDIGVAFGNVADLGAKFNPVVNTVQALTDAVDSAGTSVARFAGIEVRDGFAPLRESFAAWVELLGGAPAAVEPVTAATEAAAAADAAYAAEMERSGSVILANQAAEAARAQSMATSAAATTVARDSAEAYRAIEEQGVAVAAASAAAQIAQANSMEMAGVQARAAAQAAQMKSDADKVAAVDAQTHGIAEQQLALQAQAAAQSLMAAGPAGAATAAMLAGSSSQVDVLTAAYYRLASAQAAAAVAAPRSTAIGQGIEQTTRRLEAQGDAYKKVRDAKERQIAQTGTEAQKQQQLQAQLERARVTYGQNSVEYINAKTNMMQADDKAAKAAAKGGAARASAAGVAATKLENIEQKTGDKIADIVENTQQKITAITEREAAKQAAALAKLNEALATSAADRRASNEADDLDLIGPMDDKQAAKLNDREKAQADARKREEAAAAEARKTAEEGDAESAGKIYDIREKQISDQQALDEKYYDKQREMAGDPAAQEALKQQYDEATRANAEAAQVRIDLANAEAAQKAAAVEAEKAGVIAAAEDEANKVISAAERSAAGVTKATASARASAVADLNAIGSAVTAIPASKTITITVSQSGTVGTASTGSGTGGTKAAGGGTFMTTGPTSLTVGDNPGGREIVTVTPVSGTGQTRVGKGMIAMAGGGTVDAGGGYTTPVAGSGTAPAPKSGGKGGGKKSATPTPVDPKKALDEMKNTIQLLMDMAKLKEQIAALAGVPAFDIPLVQALVQRAQEFTAYVSQHLIVITKDEGESLGRYMNAAKDAASMIGDMASLKKDIAELKDVPAFDKAMVFALIDRAQEFTTAVQQHLIPLTEFERDQIGRYTQAVSDVVGMFKDVSDLKKELATPAPPIETNYIWQLVADAAAVTSIMRSQLLVTTEDQVDALSRYASASSDSISILKDTSDLRKELAEPTSPISSAAVLRLAEEATRVVKIVRGFLVPTSQAQADALSGYASVVSDTVGILSDVLSLGKDLKEGGAPSIPDAMIIRLADQAARIVTLVEDRLLPASQDQVDALSAYADLVSSSTSIMSDVAGLGGDLFTDYVSPTDAQIAMLADDARRITKGFFDAGRIMGKDGAEAGKAYAEGVGAAFSAAKDGLLVIEALKSGDFVLPEVALAQFKTSSMDVLTTMEALGARAAQIPASDIAALAGVTASISGQAEAMIKLTAVPWGDLGNAVQGLSSSGGAMSGMGGGMNITNYNTFQLPSGTPQQIATEALRLLNQQMGSRR